MKTWAFVLFALTACRSALPVESSSELVTEPVLLEVPPPPLGLVEPPRDGELARNGGIVGLFGAEGQTARYAFDARAGETCSLDLASFGNARGWRSTARVRVLDPDGREVAACERSGPTLYHVITNFVAARDGRHVYELGAASNVFRYRLTFRVGRWHRGFGAVDALGLRERVIGCLLDDGDRARYSLELGAGEEATVALTNFEEDARVERRTSNTPGGRDAMFGSCVYPGFELATRGAADIVAAGPRFVRLVGRGGAVEFTVSASGRTDGGLFVLDVARAPRTHPVGGVVIDGADRELGGVGLTFLRLDDREPWAKTTTDADGRYRVDLAPGRYEIALDHDGRRQLASTQVVGERTLDLLFAPAAR
ncbi:MAG: carboxypeptidase-like regulatory domain-containing protein [Planctomycetes bacterium]|nr:carboxypeptidase-like regulatory domain-containing protein [Planctomycetota bacterium]